MRPLGPGLLQAKKTPNPRFYAKKKKKDDDGEGDGCLLCRGACELSTAEWEGALGDGKGFNVDGDG